MKRQGRHPGFWVVLLIGLSPVACFRGLNVSKIKCNSAESCPSGHTCVLDDGGLQGVCVQGQSGGAGGGLGRGGAQDTGDGGTAGASGTHGSAGGSGARDLDGGMSPDGRTGDVGAGGTAGTGGGAGTSVRGGSAGTPNPDAAVSTGGMSGQFSAPTSTTVLSSGGSGGGGAGGVTTTPVDAPVVPPDVPSLKSLGAQCENGTECASGFCADKVCCDGECKGQCESCSTAGKCTTAPKGPAPASRTACAGTGVCAAQCDGLSGAACAFPEMTICTPAVCKNGLATPAVYCSNGTCGTPQSATPCPSGACEADGTKCTGSCTVGACGTQYCNTSTGICTSKGTLGTRCSSKDECVSGFCVDDVCCDSECKDQCMACNSAGACSRITGEPKNGRPLCTTSIPKCAGKCDLTSNTCVYPDSSTICETAKCSSDQTSVVSKSCNLGACSKLNTESCGSASYCSGASCIPRAENGGGCTSAVQCTSNFCTGDGVCCPSGYIACFGVCQNGQSDPNNCGGCGVSCASNQTCDGGNCRCNGLQCGTTCNSTGFESGTLDGWSADGSTYDNAASNLRVITGTTHSGSRMLNATVGFADATLFATADFLVPLCSSGSATVTSFSVWVAAMKTTADFTLSGTFTFKDASNAVVKTVSPSTTIPSDGTWRQLTGTVSAQASKVQVRFTSPQYPTYALIYIDDAQFN